MEVKNNCLIPMAKKYFKIRKKIKLDIQANISEVQ